MKTKIKVTPLTYQQALEEAYRLGIREVVEWLERAKKIKVPKYQLKEWGVR